MIEQTNGATVITGQKSIALFRLLAIKGRLKLEMRGLKFRGGSTFAAVKREFNLKGNQSEVFAAFEKIVEEAGRAHQQSQPA